MQTTRTAPPGFLEHLRQDLRFAVRSLAKRPGFTAAAVVTLAVGIGGAVAMFSVANLALFRALPYPDAEELVVGRTSWPDGGIGTTVSAPDYFDVREQASSFRAIGAVTPFTFDGTLTGGQGAERVPVAWASPGFFRVLGVAPLLGREFLPSEGEPGGSMVAIISHRLWQDRYGGRADIIGSTSMMEGMPGTVIGVLPPGFRFLEDVDIYLPMVPGEAFASQRRYHNWLVVARLADGVTVDGARSEVDVIMSQLAAEYPESNEGKGMVIDPLQDAMVEGLRPALLILMGAIGLLLLIACANVASLMLARGSGRTTELAVRAAMGAGRGRLVGQLLVEATVLAAVGGLLGAGVAVMAQRTLVAATPLTRLGLEAVGLQPEVLLFAVVLSVGTVLIFGLAPALAAARVEAVEGLRSGSRSVAGGRSRFRDGLVVVQVALSVLLLVGAGLLVRSFAQLRGVDPGFEAEQLITAEIGLPRGVYTDPAQRNRFFDDYLEKVRAMPGVESAALASYLPIKNRGNNVGVWATSTPPANASEVNLAYIRIVKPGYFETLGIPILRGRDVRATDTENAAPVIIIDSTMAAALFPNQNPIGRQVVVDAGEPRPVHEVVGVVGNVHPSSLAGGPEWTMYFPYGQGAEHTMRLAVRTAGPPTALVPSLRRALAELDPDVPLAGVASMDEVLTESVSFTRTVMAALAAFAAVAVFLAIVGLYGVLAYYVSRRTHEIGVRVALGAGVREVLGLVLSRGLIMVGLGLALGSTGALLGGRLVADLLFRVEAGDPPTLVAVTLLFTLVAVAACLVPAWRAWRVDPVEAFRAE